MKQVSSHCLEEGRASAGSKVSEGDSDKEGILGKKRTARWVEVLRSSAGLLVAALAALCFSLMSLLVKITMPYMKSVLLLLCVRFVIQGLITLLVYFGPRMLRQRKEKAAENAKLEQEGGFLGPPSLRGWILLRGLLSGCASMAFFLGLTQLPLGDASALYSTVPLIAAVLAWLWLREKFHWLNWVAGVSAAVGVLIIARPPFLAPVLDPLGLPPSPLESGDVALVSRPVGVSIVLIASLCAAAGIVIVRKIRQVSSATSVFSMSACTLVLSLVLLLGWERQRPSLEDLSRIPFFWGWGGAILTGLASSATHLLATLSVQLELTGPATFVSSLDTVFAFILQVLVLGTSVGLGSIVGSCLIFLSVLLLFAVKIWCVPAKVPPSLDPSAKVAEGSEGEDVEGGRAPASGEVEAFDSFNVVVESDAPPSVEETESAFRRPQEHQPASSSAEEQTQSGIEVFKERTLLCGGEEGCRPSGSPAADAGALKENDFVEENWGERGTGSLPRRVSTETASHSSVV
uniref:EamA domain-containing protein n=1 Tax=Chromera velia CCMP2878 TaxID=1169474 RepID=A0A0G4HX01_9ALVE|eukprot:Cvel_1458.t1-p1 / transcript=Cvel_1458.t1 / gene=Cvel_1458 / organism=Chromera_velia_CCMP2878 / gene_product=Solute carrier family 35 member G1, putative / transcript_product=Solute carrier family 35 member G1, putative / location=Cvel_scaffold51:52494-54818(+) / protein_length=517 / sequence_SO=supercontig / SO=protein_coding / is_pseudo=false